MLNEHAVQHVYLACGSTDLRKSIDGLAALVQGVPPAKREFTTLRKFQNKKPNFSTLKLRNWTFFVTLEKRPIAEYGKCEKRFRGHTDKKRLMLLEENGPFLF